MHYEKNSIITISREVILSRTTFLFLATFFIISPAFCNTISVKREVNLRRNPSTDQPPIQLLSSGTQLELIESNDTKGFYHIKTQTGAEGWVWGGNVGNIKNTDRVSITNTPHDNTYGCFFTILLIASAAWLALHLISGGSRHKCPKCISQDITLEKTREYSYESTETVTDSSVLLNNRNEEIGHIETKRQVPTVESGTQRLYRCLFCTHAWIE